ncbi:MAG TPA: hypothetical protein VFJ91_12525 [Gaiellaceae bacterium]|nr:hypothetical protein [Gaiellaceae bacterium]
MVAPLSLSVLWSERADDVVAGRLDLDEERLVLHGGSRDVPRRLEIALTEVRDVRLARRVRERLRDRTTLQIELGDGRLVSVATLASLGALHELGDRLSSAASG